MDTEENEIINVNAFIESRIRLIRDDYFVRSKDVNECIKSDMQLPEPALKKLEEMCKYIVICLNKIIFWLCFLIFIYFFSSPKLLNTEENQKKIDSLSDFDFESLSLLEYLYVYYNKFWRKKRFNLF